MKVSRSLVDCSIHSETHSHQRVGRELACEMVKYLKVTFYYLPETISSELSLETVLTTLHL